MPAKALAFLVSLVVLLGAGLGWRALADVGGRPAVPDDPRAHLPVRPEPLDHAAFFPDPLPDGPAVTRRCLECHPSAAAEVMATSHWTWAGARATTTPTQGGDTGAIVAIGKANLQNNFCIAVAGNWARCTSCHVGYGWREAGFPQQAGPDRVDCLVCHDTTGTYRKAPTGAGEPAEDVDLLEVARHVGWTSRATCGSCHFEGGGGNAVKHGDLEAALVFPPERVDVHMGRHDLRCADCHRTEHHRIRGRLLPPEAHAEERASCTACHAATPHGDVRLDGHVATVACQTCHVPRFALEAPTKLWWDWSAAGAHGDPEHVAQRLLAETLADPAALAALPAPVREGFRRAGTDPDIEVRYDRKKGLFLLGRNLVPEYRWYDGRARRYLPGERDTEDGPLVVSAPRGGVQDDGARIWPFKIHRGRQPFDLEHRHLLSPHLFGEGGYWQAFDWDRALKAGARASGVPYGGRFGWRETEMAWPQTHMVQAKEHALACTDCHGERGRMDWAALGYPGDPAERGGRARLGLLPGRPHALAGILGLDASASSKEDLARPWDVHAARLLDCADCHAASERGTLHAGGPTRQCETCHDAASTHAAWLPDARRHVRALRCEACHVPRVHGAAVEVVDRSVLRADGTPTVLWRGLADGYEPVLLPRRFDDGAVRHGPHTLVTTWTWTAGEAGAVVSGERLEAAFLDGAGGHHPDLVAMLDQDGDGTLSDGELRLDTAARAEGARRRLEAAGVQDPRLVGVVQAFSLHHGVATGRYATRRCEDCHTPGGRLERPFPLAPFVPVGASVRIAAPAGVSLPGRIRTGGDGGLRYEPDPAAAGRHVAGAGRGAWIDRLGLLLVLAVAAGAAVHGALRVRSASARAGRRREAIR